MVLTCVDVIGLVVVCSAIKVSAGAVLMLWAAALGAHINLVKESEALKACCMDFKKSFLK